ncbi:MAG: 50S ribosomal protein L1 [Spirochaetales bacterium]|jgi:large subunit ribosomal protein L1|nr:50S ribosomal protein L1 [Spirochaetales bacterium]
MKRGKKYAETVKKYNPLESYTPEKAVDVVKQTAYAKFDETVDISINLSLKKSQTVRDTLVLPYQFKGEKKILVFAKGEKVEEAKQAGATYVGDDDLIEKIKGGWLDFDVAVATPDMMKDVGRLGQILGRRGLMPNPKTQTVTFDVKAAVNELKKGRVEYRSDKTGAIHLAVGKVSMDAKAVAENIAAVLQDVERKRPPDAKGNFIKSVYVSSTMGPGVRVVRGEQE